MPINTSTLPVQCAITKHMCVFFFFKYQKTNLKKKIYTQKVTNVFLISIKFNTTKKKTPDMINCLKPPLLTANNAVKYIPMNGLEYKRSAKVSLLFIN